MAALNGTHNCCSGNHMRAFIISSWLIVDKPSSDGQSSLRCLAGSELISSLEQQICNWFVPTMMCFLYFVKLISFNDLTGEKCLSKRPRSKLGQKG